jgi:hypothetical protein
MQAYHVRPHLPLILTLLANAVAAQSPVASPATTSLAALTSAPLQYQSAISTYQSYTDQPVQSWRDANDNVGRIGGWRAYAREMSGKEATNVDSTAKPTTNPTAPPHSGHHKEVKP